jgi:hypothetical protein
MAEQVRYGQVDREYAQRLATTPAAEEGPVWMVNLMRYRDVADYGEASGGEAISGREADDRYTPNDALAAVGAEIVFVADVDQQLLGDGPAWDRVAVVKYPTHRSFIDMQRRDDFRRQHVHKDAGMAATIVMGGQPMPTPQPPEGRAMPGWDEVPYPPTADDGYVVVLHVLRYHDAEAAAVTPEHMVEYQTAAGRVALGHGVRVPAWFAIEGTIVGDGRAWHQARFNAFPSKRAFMEVVMDPERLEAQANHREVAIADTYTMILRPRIDRLEASLSPRF